MKSIKWTVHEDDTEDRRKTVQEQEGKKKYKNPL